MAEKKKTKGDSEDRIAEREEAKKRDLWRVESIITVGTATMPWLRFKLVPNSR